MSRRIAQAEADRRLRGLILKLVIQEHRAQAHRMDGITLAAILDRLGYPVGTDTVLTLCQDMKKRGLIDFIEERNTNTGKVRILKIETAPRGWNVMEGTEVDPGVTFD